MQFYEYILESVIRQCDSFHISEYDVRVFVCPGSATLPHVLGEQEHGNVARIVAVAQRRGL